VKNIAINPTFFYSFDETSSLRIGINHPFTEENKSTRLASQISYQKSFSEDANLTIRNSVNFFDRSIEIPDFIFDGQQIASFSEVSYSTANEKADWVFGANMWTKAALESGLRIDYNTDYDWFVLPRINLLLDLNEHWTTRIGGGMGYKLPTIFSEEAESRTFQSILPIGINDTKAETSAGVNLDVNYKTILFDEVSFSINNLFFYTQLFDPLILTQDVNDQFIFVNADGKTDSKGLETNIKFSYDDFKLYLQYAFIDAQLDYDGINRQKPITPRHNAGGILMYESGKWRLGYEVYFTGVCEF